MAIEILDLIAKQKQEGNFVYENYLTAVKMYKEVFKRYGHQQLADQLPELRPVSSTREKLNSSGSSISIVSTLRQASTSQTLAPAGTEELVNNSHQSNQTTAKIFVAPSDRMKTPQDIPDDMSTSQTEAADIELELNELPSLDQQELPFSNKLAETLNEALQSPTAVFDNSGNE